MLNRSRSYSRPKVSSSHFIERLERFHRVVGARRGRPRAPRCCRSTSRPLMVVKLSRVGDEIARDQREQIARLGPRIVPFGPVACRPRLRPRRSRLPLDSSTGNGSFDRLHPHAVGRQDIGPVGEEGDAAEALGLALRAQHAVRGIEPHQLGVGRRDRSRWRSRPEVRVSPGSGHEQVVAVHRPVVARLRHRPSPPAASARRR